MERSTLRVGAALVLASGVTLAAVRSLSAQTLWVPPTEGKAVAIEYVRPHEPAEVRRWFSLESAGAIHGAFFLSGAWPVAGGVRAVLEVPYAVVTGEDSPCTDVGCPQSAKGDAIGNPYVGAEVPIIGRTLRWHGGVRLPLQSVSADWSDDYWGRYAAATGLHASRAERSGAFQKDVSSATSLIELRQTIGQGTSTRALVGAVLVHDHVDGWTFDEQSGWIHHQHDFAVEWQGAAQLWQRVGPLVLNAGVHAANRQSYYEGPRVTECEWGAALGLRLGALTPLVHARIPSYRPDATAGLPSRTEWWNLAFSLQVQPR